VCVFCIADFPHVDDLCAKTRLKDSLMSVFNKEPREKKKKNKR
jgi:hypothetical protein